MNFLEILKVQQEKINRVLADYLGRKRKDLPVFSNDFVRQQHDLFGEYCLRNGKRLRPILTLMAYKAVGGKKEKEIIVPALAFELYHNYTLIHDDIYDEDEQRRGEIANHVLFQKWFEKKYSSQSVENILFKNAAARFGAVAGIINGKYLHTLSSLPILESKISDQKKVEGMKLHQLVSIFDNTGQAIDLYFEREKEVGERDYYNMVLCKTGQLFKSAIEWGVILGEGSRSQRKALSSYMEEAAIVFQMQDDILDIDPEGDKGRELGSDIKKGKKTLLMIHALKNASPAQRKKILSVLGKEMAKEQEIKEVISILEKSGSVDYCREEAAKRLKKGIRFLDAAKPSLDGEAKQFFCELADFMLKRSR